MPDVTNPTKHDISPAVGRQEKMIRSRPALTTQQLQDQPGLHEISLGKKTTQNRAERRDNWMAKCKMATTGHKSQKKKSQSSSVIV